MRKITVCAAAVLLLGGLGACSDVSRFYTGGDFEFEVPIDTLTRQFMIHVPPDLDPDQPVPLLFMLHGTGQRGPELQAVSDVDRFADAAGVITVYPEAQTIGTIHAWAAPLTIGAERGVDDPAFFNEMIDVLVAEFNVDETRLFIAGISNGGVASQWIGCQLNDRLLGFASVAATVLTEIVNTCSPAGPMATMFFLGTDDPIFLWDGVVGPNFEQLSAEASVSFHADLNSCGGTPTVTPVQDFVPQDSSTVSIWEYDGCEGGIKILMYGVDGGSHTWPGSPVESPGLGCTSRDIHASQIIIDFLLSGGTMAPANTAAGDSTSRGCERPFQ